MIQEYIRTTHNFNNDTREWDYRGDRGGDKYGIWNIQGDERIQKLEPIWSMSVHVLKRDSWINMKTIIDYTIGMFNAHASDRTIIFKEFIKNNVNHRKIIKSDILKEFEILLELDMIRNRERDVFFNVDYWSN